MGLALWCRSYRRPGLYARIGASTYERNGYFSTELATSLNLKLCFKLISLPPEAT